MCCAQYAVAWLPCKWTLGPHYFGVVHIPDIQNRTSSFRCYRRGCIMKIAYSENAVEQLRQRWFLALRCGLGIDP